MTREEALETAREVLANKTRSHVGAARALAEYVLAHDAAIAEHQAALATPPNADELHQ